MRVHNAVLVGLLLCSYGFPTGTSFYFSQTACWTATAACRRPHSPDHVSRSRSSIFSLAQRPRRSSRNPHGCVAEDAATTATHGEKQYTRADLEQLSRAELQAICKSLDLRAVGKTSELLSRVLEKYGEHEPLEIETTRRPTPSPVATSTDTVTAASDGVVESLEGATIDELLSAVGAGLGSANGSSSSTTTTSGGSASARGEPTTRAEVAAEAPPTDFVMEDVRPVFDELSDEQWAKVGQLGQLLTEWNGKINLISRKDIANVMKRHLIPCLAMAKALNFEDGIYVLDVGTGGGLPGLPLAICYPNVKFTLIDGTGKKIAAVTDMAERLGLTNVRTFHVRAEEVHEVFDFVMGRAVTNLPKFVGFIDKNLKPNDAGANSPNPGDSSDSDRGSSNNASTLKRGVLYMRGEVSEEELAELGAQPSAVIPLQRVLEEAGQDGDVGLGGGVDDRGYSSVFHFTSEAIWNRVPVTAGLGDGH